jgi:hypothetical protein
MVSAVNLAGSTAIYSLQESTPLAVAPKLLNLIQSLGLQTPVYVPVVPLPGAEPGWCYRNVKAIESVGGRPVHGGLIWSCRLFATVESHVMHGAPDGGLLDVTPKLDGEKSVMFAADPSKAADYDFMQRPANVRIRLYEGPTPERRAADLIACMSQAEERAQTRKAQEAGLSLQVFVAKRMGPDPLEVAIDRFLACCDEAESLLRPTPQGQFCEDKPRWRALEARKAELALRLARQWQAHPARLSAEAAGRDA